ncbi:MOSC and FAD-binding oxidoreductase domain-containing protein [Tunturibacter psychrotolerans]|uniref:MOSC and FAD-binding oxidoreductase domain-containing protein n=1 Tax=Tunturiibacter psychrotolerans TaxID=3069686 RepID=A0AAU7ZQU4_9BACT
MVRLLSVNVGLPRNIDWEGKTVHTGIWKSPVQGRRFVRRLNIEGDGQGDLAGHGGEHRAVFVYQTDSYRYWEKQLGRSDFTFGQFGENFTVDGLSDGEVCIGDRYRIGNALFEVTQPRVTCYRVGIRMNEPRMASLLVAHHRPGFYFRVLEEGDVGSEDEIVKVADGPMHMTVAEADALLYLSAHSPDQLRRALKIPALSPGWQASFRTMLEKEEDGLSTGNAGLAPTHEPPPAWPGFRQLRVSQMDRESSSVLSFVLTPADGQPLSPALPGQFVVLRLHPKEYVSPLLRNYSLSGPQNADCYRVSIKREANGAASTYLHTQVQRDDLLEVSAPRGNFTLLPGDGSVVLLSAGVGATPVLAMLHRLAAESSQREVWWLYGARNSGDHPFDKESRDLLQSLQHGRSHIRYSRPLPADRLGANFDAPGHLDVAAIETLGVPRTAHFYLCGPTTFISDLTAGLVAWGVDAARVHAETFGPGGSMTPGVIGATARPPHPPDTLGGLGPLVSFARSNLTVAWDKRFQSLLELAEACDVPVRWACRTGVCHTCETSLISGTVNYQLEPLQAAADGHILICCCQPNDELVVDL